MTGLYDIKKFNNKSHIKIKIRFYSMFRRIMYIEK